MQKFHFDAEKLMNSPLSIQARNRAAAREDLTKNHKQNYEDKNIAPDIKISQKQVFKRIDPAEFHRINTLMALWGVINAGSVIKHQGPTYALTAVNITLQLIDKVENPGAYFRGVLRNLQKGL